MLAVLLLPEAAAAMGAGLCYASVSNPEAIQDIIETAAEAIGITAEVLAQTLKGSIDAFMSAASASTTAAAISSPLASTTVLSASSKLASATTSKAATVVGEAAAKETATNTAKSRIKQALPWIGAAAVVGAVVFGAIYYMSPTSSNTSSSQKEPVPIPSTASASPANGGDPDSDDEDKKDKGPAKASPPQLDKDVLISKRLIENLIKANGKDMHHKLNQKLTAERVGNIWTDPKGNFRIDAGSTLKNHPRVKTWNLQVNKKPALHAAQNLLKKHSTHAKLLWGTWDLDNPPDYVAWVEATMRLFEPRNI